MKQYIVTVNDGRIGVSQPDGNPIDIAELTYLQKNWSRFFSPQKYLYMGRVGQTQLKVGVSKDVRRRSIELKMWRYHYVPCIDSTVWKYEKDLLELFSKLPAVKSVDGEMFEFSNSDLCHMCMNNFASKVKDEKSLDFFVLNLTLEQIATRKTGIWF